uniref:Putative ovule protein n=1 Tax=Solanum chacoense TaxID=4108 RepID=A0A0V0GLP4_SOLCH
MKFILTISPKTKTPKEIKKRSKNRKREKNVKGIGELDSQTHDDLSRKKYSLPITLTQNVKPKITYLRNHPLSYMHALPR